jgi:methylmalonyl-CoA mutase N-terminal domain/subunit
MGGMVSAIEKGYPQREIAASSYRFQRQVEEGERRMVGVNVHVQDAPGNVPMLRIDPEIQRIQCTALAKVKASRDASKLAAALSAVRDAARSGANLMPPIVESAKAYATEQEICDVLREELGTYTDPAEF